MSKDSIDVYYVIFVYPHTYEETTTLPILTLAHAMGHAELCVRKNLLNVRVVKEVCNLSEL